LSRADNGIPQFGILGHGPENDPVDSAFRSRFRHRSQGLDQDEGGTLKPLVDDPARFDLSDARNKVDEQFN